LTSPDHAICHEADKRLKVSTIESHDSCFKNLKITVVHPPIVVDLAANVNRPAPDPAIRWTI